MMCEDHSSLTLCLCLSTVLLTGATAYCQASGETVLVFSKPFAGVYLKRGNSSKRIILRHGPSLAPRLSPDGSRLLVNSFEGGGRGVWIGHQDGQEMKRICDGDQGEWSPEGDRIVFRRNGRIVERRLDAGTEEIVTPSGWTDCRFPTYRRDGSILFVRGQGAGSKVFLLDLKEGNVPQELLEAEILSAPRCSPDGQALAYQDGAHIHLMNLEDGRRSQLTTAGGVQSWPIWSLDGKSVTYCQAPDPFGPWDVHNVEIDNPSAARIIQRGVDLAPDWRGIGSPSAQSVGLNGSRFAVWVRTSNEEPLSLARVPSTREGWKPLSRVRERLAVEKPILVENDWHSVVIAPGQGALAVFSKTQGSDARPVTIGLAAEEVSAVSDGTYSYAILTSGSEEFLCEVSLKDEAGRPAKALCSISRARPSIQLTPLSDVREFLITSDTPFVLMPDRFSNDLLIQAAKYSAAEVLLPSSPFVLAPSVDGGSAMMLITPSMQQSLRLMRNRGVFSQIRAAPAGEPLFISLLPPRGFSYDLPSETDAEAKATTIAWVLPFAGRWRAGLFGKRNHSRMIDEKKTSSGGSQLLIERFAEPADIALVYLYGRSRNTPLHTFSPEDIVQDALGIQASYLLLDIQGIARNPSAEERLALHGRMSSWEGPLPSLTGYGPGQAHSGDRWHRFLQAHTDFYPVLELLGSSPKDLGLYMANTEGLRSTVVHLCDDVIGLLTGLDKRISDYEEFLSVVQRFCESGQEASPAAVDLLNQVKGDMKALRAGLRDLTPTAIATVEKSSADIKALLGSNDWLAKTRQFETFREVSHAALSERQGVLREFREFAKTVRDNSGYAIAEKPDLKRIAEDLRKMSQAILRDRYALEVD